MLKFVFGKPLSGKTSLLIKKIKELSLENNNSVLLVPEQFTFESEKSILKYVGDAAFLNTTVLSFSRLCDEINRHSGGVTAKVLTDCEKIIFMNKALQEVSPELSLWKGYSDSVNFAKNVLDTVGELKINYILPENLRELADRLDNQYLQLKLRDLALIYEAYDLAVGEKYIDPADRLTLAYNKLEGFEYFKGKTVFIDSFKGFTGQQHKLIERIIAQAKDVYISFTYNPKIGTEYNIFSNIRSTVNKLEVAAKKYSIDVEYEHFLDKSHYSCDSLTALESLISGEKPQPSKDEICLCKCETIFDEAEFAARTIRRLVRTQGMRYRDFVVISRDAEMYSTAVLNACERNNVSCFYDNRIPLSVFPIATAVKSVLCALSFSTEEILRFHKTGIGTLSVEEISDLENYCFLWNIDGKQWLSDWTMDYRGFNTDNTDNKNETELERLNSLRKKAILPIVNFNRKENNNAVAISRAIVELLEECGCKERLIEISENLENNKLVVTTEILDQAFREFYNVLDSIVNCLGEKNISIKKYSEILNLAVSLSSISTIPQTIDRVTFGSADRIKTSAPKIAFILGANQGLFPMITGNAGIFNITDRKLLIESGLDISDNAVRASIDEEYLLYCSLCCATDGLYITYHNRSVSGELCEPSSVVGTIAENLPVKYLSEPLEELSHINAPETDKSAYSEFCKRFSRTNDMLTIKKALDDTPLRERISNIRESIEGNVKKLSAKTAKRLYGENINMSASRFDMFHRCKFSYFCRYGLKAEKLRPVDFNVMQRGTVVHYVFEMLITEHKEDIGTLSNDELDVLTDCYIERYLSSIKGFMDFKTVRTDFLISRISRSLKEVVKHIAVELSQSKFVPVACELKIGKRGDIKDVSFPFDNGEIYLNGSIDRVDEYNGYIRIIDYKTGSKSFKLPDILFGLNLQMPLYLYAVTRGSGKADSSAAAILYQPSKRDLNNNGLAMNGLLQEDKELISAMEENLAGDYVPKLKYNKDGSLSKNCTSFINAEQFGMIFDYIEKIMRECGNSLHSGDISIDPLDGVESPACTYCDFASVCGFEDSKPRKVLPLDRDEVFKIIREEVDYGN